MRIEYVYDLADTSQGIHIFKIIAKLKKPISIPGKQDYNLPKRTALSLIRLPTAQKKAPPSHFMPPTEASQAIKQMPVAQLSPHVWNHKFYRTLHSQQVVLTPCHQLTLT